MKPVKYDEDMEERVNALKGEWTTRLFAAEIRCLQSTMVRLLNRKYKYRRYSQPGCGMWTAWISPIPVWAGCWDGMDRLWTRHG